MEKDAVGTDKARPDFWAEVHKCFNDTSYKPQSLALDSSWGHWFEESHDLSLENMKPFGEFCLKDSHEPKERWRNLSNQLDGVKKNWKNSGEGDDTYGKDVEDGKTDVVDPDKWKGGDRVNFLRNCNR